MIHLIRFAKKMDSGTQVESGTTQKITRKKKESIKLKYSAGNVVVNHDENPPCGGSLHIMGSLFLGSVHKNPGTKVADNRN